MNRLLKCRQKWLRQQSFQVFIKLPQIIVIIVFIVMKRNQLEKIVKQHQKQILRKKAQILMEWVSFMYTSQHRCIVTIIADKTYREVDLPIGEIDKFKNGANLIKDLQEGLIVCLVYKENKSIQVKINQQFFNLLPTLIQKIKAKIDPIVANLTDLKNLDKDTKICKNCSTKKTLKQIEFMGESCDCPIPNFLPIEKNSDKLQKYTLIQGMLKRTQQNKNKIDEKTNEIHQLQKTIDDINNRKISEYELFIRKYGQPDRAKLIRTPEMMAEAERYFKSLQNLGKRGMKEILASRKRRDDQEFLKKMEREPCWFTQIAQQALRDEGELKKQVKQQEKQQKQIKKEAQRESIKRVRKIGQPQYIVQQENTENTALTPKQQSISKKELYGFALKQKDRRKQQYLKLFNLAIDQLQTSIHQNPSSQSPKSSRIEFFY